ncbi:GNAT family N-acetyltransferase [Streptomyces jumonjinensis]|uniref:GNAT family N-acetyltransferase n=1 Tax=Streptomyces jumonjinensis TaxID=1945 RepID=UPI0037914FA9
MTTDDRVRPATPDDIPTAVRTLGRAFSDYPYTRHVVAADDHAERVRRFQELFLTRVGMVYGRVWVGDGGLAVAAWTTPDQDPTPGLTEVAPSIGELAGDRAEAFEATEKLVEPYRPTEPVWYLATVGVDPDAQGRGLGSAVLRPGIEAAARAGYPIHLETATERNVSLYERLGFKVTAEVTVPDGGPHIWCMRKDVS